MGDPLIVEHEEHDAGWWRDEARRAGDRLDFALEGQQAAERDRDQALRTIADIRKLLGDHIGATESIGTAISKLINKLAVAIFERDQARKVEDQIGKVRCEVARLLNQTLPETLSDAARRLIAERDRMGADLRFYHQNAQNAQEADAVLVAAEFKSGTIAERIGVLIEYTKRENVLHAAEIQRLSAAHRKIERELVVQRDEARAERHPEPVYATDRLSLQREFVTEASKAFGTGPDYMKGWLDGALLSCECEYERKKNMKSGTP